jgi:WD40 repeat protein
MDWSIGNSNIIATACVQGDVKIFDIRAPQTAAQSMTVAGACNTVAWCPCRPNYFASSCKDTAFVWDTRMLSIAMNKDFVNTGDFAIQSGHGTVEACNVSPPEGVQHMVWASSESPCLVTVSTSGVVSWWNGTTGVSETSCECPPMGADSMVLPSPVGKGLVSTQREDPKLISQPLGSSASFPHMASMDLPLGGGAEPYQKLRFLSSTLERLDRSEFQPTSVWINGYPKSVLSD